MAQAADLTQNSLQFHPWNTFTMREELGVDNIRTVAMMPHLSVKTMIALVAAKYVVISA